MPEDKVELCAICEKPIVPHVDAVYSIPTKEGRFRHWDCWKKHHSPDAVFSGLREALGKIDEARGMLADIRKKL